jgi:hypothetical protein
MDADEAVNAIYALAVKLRNDGFDFQADRLSDVARDLELDLESEAENAFIEGGEE